MGDKVYYVTTDYGNVLLESVVLVTKADAEAEIAEMLDSRRGFAPGDLMVFKLDTVTGEFHEIDLRVTRVEFDD